MVKELAKKILEDMYPLESDDELIIEVMLEFGKKVCELQKKECLRNAEGKARWAGDIEVDEDTILYSKNVCE